MSISDLMIFHRALLLLNLCSNIPLVVTHSCLLGYFYHMQLVSSRYAAPPPIPKSSTTFMCICVLYLTSRNLVTHIALMSITIDYPRT